MHPIPPPNDHMTKQHRIHCHKIPPHHKLQPALNTFSKLLVAIILCTSHWSHCSHDLYHCCKETGKSHTTNHDKCIPASWLSYHSSQCNDLVLCLQHSLNHRFQFVIFIKKECQKLFNWPFLSVCPLDHFPEHMMSSTIYGNMRSKTIITQNAVSYTWITTSWYPFQQSTKETSCIAWLLHGHTHSMPLTTSHPPYCIHTHHWWLQH